MIDINSIKSRVGSISNKTMIKLPAAVRKLLLIDMIDLIQHYEATKPELGGMSKIKPDGARIGNG